MVGEKTTPTPTLSEYDWIPLPYIVVFKARFAFLVGFVNVT